MPHLYHPKTPIGFISEAKTECIECNICSSVMNEPITLECGHSFCKKCIYCPIETTVPNLNIVIPALNNKCPTCRNEIKKYNPIHSIAIR